MTKLLSITFVVLFAGIGSCFFLTPYADDLRYPSRSIISTLFSNQETPKDLRNLQYPNQSLLSTILGRIVSAFTKIMSAVRSFDLSAVLPRSIASNLSFLRQLVQSTLGFTNPTRTTSTETDDFDDDFGSAGEETNSNTFQHVEDENVFSVESESLKETVETSTSSPAVTEPNVTTQTSTTSLSFDETSTEVLAMTTSTVAQPDTEKLSDDFSNELI